MWKTEYQYVKWSLYEFVCMNGNMLDPRLLNAKHVLVNTGEAVVNSVTKGVISAPQFASV